MSIRKENLVLAAKGVIKAEAKSYVVDDTVATEFDSMAVIKNPTVVIKGKNNLLSLFQALPE